MLTSERVKEIIMDCLFGSAEGPGSIKIEGVMRGFVLSEEKLAIHRDEIMAMLQELPDQFFVGTGDGWSFLNLCMTKDGRQWGEHIDCEALCVLAFGIGAGHWLMPREMWPTLPGSMPYVAFNRTIPSEVAS